VRLGQHSDAELVQLAKAGWSPAFAVLAYRHAPTVRTALADEDDPLSATTAVFIHAMRELRQRDAASPVGPWLLELIDRPPPPAPATMDAEELDALWRELHRRWPDGERPATTWPWRRLAVVAGLAVVAAAVPALVLGVGSPTDADPELRAVPVTGETTTADLDDEHDEDLSGFSFPVAPDEDDGSDATPESTPTEPTEADPAPTETAPEPEPAPEPQPQPEPAPEPEPEPEPESSSPPEDDGEEEDSSPLDPIIGEDDGDTDDDTGSSEDGEAAATRPS
jgi:hypothetical protein